MSPGDEEWLERWLLARRERMRAVNEALRDQLRHSYDQIREPSDATSGVLCRLRRKASTRSKTWRSTA